jgi:outer membrane protein assembly factor BamB
VVVFGEGQGASDSGVVALDLSTHRQRWRVALGGEPAGGIAIDGDAVFAGARDGFVYRIDVATGAVAWRARAGAPVTTAIAVRAQRVFCLAEDTNTGDSIFTAFSATNGHKLWTFAPPRFATGGSTPTVAGGTVYTGFGDGVVRAFRVSNGAIRWQSPTRSPFSGLSAPAFEGRALFIADIGGGLYRFDAATGRTVWDYQFPGFAQWGSPLTVGGSVYLGLEDGDDGVLAAVRASDGHLTWERRTTGGPIGALASTGDSLLVPSVGPTGGLTAYVHDPTGTLTNLPSRTELHLPMALLDFAIAFLILGAALLALGRLVNRGRAGIPVEVGAAFPLDDGDGRGG